MSKKETAGGVGPGSREGVSRRPQARIAKRSRAPAACGRGSQAGTRFESWSSHSRARGQRAGDPTSGCVGASSENWAQHPSAAVGYRGPPRGRLACACSARVKSLLAIFRVSPESQARRHRVVDPQILRPEPSLTNSTNESARRSGIARLSQRQAGIEKRKNRRGPKRKPFEQPVWTESRLLGGN